VTSGSLAASDGARDCLRRGIKTHAASLWPVGRTHARTPSYWSRRTPRRRRGCGHSHISIIIISSSSSTAWMKQTLIQTGVRIGSRRASKTFSSCRLISVSFFRAFSFSL